MPLSNFPQKIIKFELTAYERPHDAEDLRRTHVPFSGAPHIHPYHAEKIVLVVDPYSTNTLYYEFRTDDITHVEEMPSIVNMDGEVVNMVRLWVKKKSIAIRSMPFVVAETL
jgi:inorganic pyrophosphatase